MSHHEQKKFEQASQHIEPGDARSVVSDSTKVLDFKKEKCIVYFFLD